MMIPPRVLIFGGTHGNEWTGIKVVEYYQEHFKQKFPELNLEFVFANPLAFKENKRFTDEDLNRAFQFLSEKRDSYEHHRARELRDLINKSPCFVIDLHTTTSNMGSTVVISHYNPLNLQICAELSSSIQNCQIIGAPDPNKKYLASQSEYSLLVEVGPVPNSVITPTVLESTVEILEGILSALADPKKLQHKQLQMYEETLDISYPTNEKNEINAYIHSSFQGKDFTPIQGDYTPFKTFQGTEMKAYCEDVSYPIFINEAAYYPQHLAFTLCTKKTVQI